MDRKGRIWSRILKVTSALLIQYGCSTTSMQMEETEVEISLDFRHESTKGMLPEEGKISDVSLMVFDEHGCLERHIYSTDGCRVFRLDLIKGARYTVLACVNFGYKVYIEQIEDKDPLEYHLAYPDEYRDGIPMSAFQEVVIIHEEDVSIELERLMARISISMDRSRLEEGVNMDVVGLRIGNCPKKVKVFAPSKVDSEDECFKVGFSHDDIGCSPLNERDMEGLSREVSLYMLENMQGKFSSEGPGCDEEKVFDDHDPRKSTCSYVEIEMEYTHEDLSSKDKPLIYRFYLGEDLNSLDIERNCHYHISVRPEDDGLHGEGWRVDKSGIGISEEPKLTQYPDDYIIADIGDRIHIGCKVTPSDAPFDVGLEYLEADKSEGIYDYEVDPDGHGVWLTLTGPGRGLIYMEAGEPVNDAALFLIEVNLP